MPREKNVISPPPVLLEKIYLLPPLHIKLGLMKTFAKGMDKTSHGFQPLHIKLGLMKTFVKGMDKTSHGFQYVRNKFPL